ncbi:translocation/assembly module TamB domain-containing protein [Castellaniella caeni]|uniref:translocation/assembly module TamB domain-containing protein n=1 Tax=Castellaniella caeni TaxID=266123 RepID=UPI00082F5942|nr:translocation/assembly module TamB domain-containing protein [Castellaniella caeni]
MSGLRQLGRGLRRGWRIVWLWCLPPLVLTLMLLLGLAWWCVASAPGTRWLLETVAEQLDGQAHGVRGSISRGVYVDGLTLSLSGTTVRVVGLHLKTLWPELWQRRLHINDLSAVRVDVAVRPTPPQPATVAEPFQMPALPIGLRIDRLALGGLGVYTQGNALPVELLSVSTALTLDAHTATLALDQLQVAHGDTLLTANGNLALRGLAAPWPFELNLHGTAQDRSAQSPVCLQRLLQGPGQSAPAPAVRGKPARAAQAVQAAEPPAAAAEAACRVDLDVRVAGTLDALRVRANAHGQGLTLEAEAEAFPQRPFPLGAAQLALTLPDQSGLTLQVQPGKAGDDGLRPVRAAFEARKLVLNPWLPKALGASRFDLAGELQLRLTPDQQVQDAGFKLTINPGSQWNGQALQGHVALAEAARVQGPLLDAGAPFEFLPVLLRGLDVALDLGRDRVRLAGEVSAAQSRLKLDAELPALAALWPGLPGAAQLTLGLDGSLAQHKLAVQGRFVPADSRAGVPGLAPVEAQLDLTGGWSDAAGWQARLNEVQLRHAGLQLRNQGGIPLALGPAPAISPAAAPRPWRWQVGKAVLDVLLDGQSLLQIQHQGSEGQAGQWQSKGRIDPLVVTPQRITDLQAWLGRGGAQAGGVHTALSEQARRSQLRLRLDWALAFAKTLSGDVRLERLDGDLTVPGDVPIQLHLQQASLALAIRPAAALTSRAALDLQVVTKDMGRLRVRAETPIHASEQGGLSVHPQDVKQVHVEAQSEDLSWVNLFLGGAAEIGGTVHADIQGRSRADGTWSFTGPLRGEGLRVLMVDQGVRLLDGTLQARFDGMRVVLERLHFPAVRRVTPKEWRTATWVTENPDAQNGGLDLSGQWDVLTQQGDVTIGFRRYPILQRADRYAMISGDLRVQASLPRIDLSGKIVADAGWFDLEMLSNIPALDGDVVVLKPGEKTPAPAATPLDVRADLSVDLGPRFYLTGFGLDSGLTGALDLSLRAGKLTALGALHTRGGAIDAYGQHLQLRRGTVTFQGDIANPVLDIQALRTDVAVQAGVQVVGTARHPRIDLVSRPEVSETEKLTWLLLGHGPDEAGGDMSLLFSVGSSFLSGGEPFYKRFGLDELSMRSGELGSTGSILPVESVVSGLDTGASPIEQRFVMASKTLSEKLKVSLEQALAQTGTVARLSYRLMRGLQAEMTVGTVSGLALVYRWLSVD